MPKRRTAEQYAAAAAAGPPPSSFISLFLMRRQLVGCTGHMNFEGSSWRCRETLAPRGEPQRRKDWQRVIKQHAALMKSVPAAPAAAASAAASAAAPAAASNDRSDWRPQCHVEGWVHSDIPNTAQRARYQPGCYNLTEACFAHRIPPRVQQRWWICFKCSWCVCVTPATSHRLIPCPADRFCMERVVSTQ
mmetsp:Transcript_4974/g.10550  ORF Transcript_4974/g.10550 Transcript_4974/m.10550 type:complete len:191 (+) Transcript_4974:1537-2109(+)